MSLDYESKHIKAIYAMLRQLPPFNTWNLPLAGQIKFTVDYDDKLLGSMQLDPLEIRISLMHQSHFHNICKTIMHEMIHLHLGLLGKKTYERHDKFFNKFRNQVAMMYNYDPLEL